MFARVAKLKENKNRAVAHTVGQQFANNSPEGLAQRKLQKVADASPQVQNGVKLHALLDNSTPPVIRGVGNGLPLVQRKRKNPSGANYANSNTEKVWVGPGKIDGHLFTKGIADQASRPELIKKVSEEGRTTGQEVHGISWVDQQSDYNKIMENKYDPFRVRFAGKYGGGMKTDLAMDFHYGLKFHGYIVKVTDHGKSADMVTNNPNIAGTGAMTEFSNAHPDTGTDRLIDKTTNVHGNLGNKADSEKSWDSYTKLAGEGARFDAVLNHQSNLTDNTKFFVRDENTMKWITFNNLWLTWAATFGKKFGVTDVEIGNKLVNNLMKKKKSSGGTEPITTVSGNPTDITTGRDFSLTNHRAATAADSRTWVNYTVTYQQRSNKKSDVQNILEGEEAVISYSWTGSGRRCKWTVKVEDNLSQLALKGKFGLNVQAKLTVA